MTTHINATHAALDAATDGMNISDIAKSIKSTTATVRDHLKALHRAGLVQSTPGTGGVPYYSLITTATPQASPCKPTPAAVAVQAAVKSQGPADITEQLRESRANELAMSQTIIAICCAIGRDPGATTTAELPQALQDHIDAQVERETTELRSIIVDIHTAIGAGKGRVTLGELPGAVKAKLDALENTINQHIIEFESLGEVVIDYMPDLLGKLLDGTRTMDMLIDAQHTHIHAQSVALEQQVAELRSRIEAQSLTSFDSANSAGRLLTEVHDTLAAGWPIGIEAPTGRTTLQLAQAMTKDFDNLHNTYLQEKFPTPNTYLVTRSDSNVATRHKTPGAAQRKAKAAIRAGARSAEIIAGSAVARAVRGAEIKQIG